MRLVRREELEETAQDSEEYKNAIRSVIQSQIQSLLQKLASETGDETIVISTSVTRGTYCQFGSCVGKEFLDERNHTAQNVGLEFNEFCTEKQSCGFIHVNHDTHDDICITQGDTGTVSEAYRRLLPVPKKKNSRKRSHLPTNQSPPNKRKPVSQYYYGSRPSQLLCTSPENESEGIETSSFKGDESSPTTRGQDSGILYSLVKHVNSSQENKSSCSTSKGVDKEAEGGATSVPWIKPEPLDEIQEATNGGTSPASNISHDGETDEHSNSITNRPKSLIPLANIFKRYGTKSEKVDDPVIPESATKDFTELKEKNETKLSERNILRALYEKPLYGLDDCGSESQDIENLSQVAINLPKNLGDTLDEFPSMSENLVLSGYYDPENYPANRHSKKHATNPAKKSKSKEKAGSSVSASAVSTPGTPNTSSPASFVESLITPGSDLKMRMFESGGRLVYACDVCKRELSHLTSYRRHMKLHTMDRPHKCPVCSKGFIRKYHCIDHINKHHKGIDFDHDTLAIRGSNRSLDDATVLSDSVSVSPSEYNYTLDQSLDESDQSVNLNTSMDQSASSMLSELARSAQKAQQVSQSGDEKNSKSVSSLPKLVELGSPNARSSGELKIKINLLEKVASVAVNQPEDDVANIDDDSAIPLAENAENGSNSTEVSTEKQENGAMARKREVTEGIKAIVAHLKSSSKKKKMLKENEHSTFVPSSLIDK